MEGKVCFENEKCEVIEMTNIIHKDQPDRIIDRLTAYAQCCDATGFYTEANCMYDAIEEIKKLRNANKTLGEWVLDDLNAEYPESMLQYPHNRRKYDSQLAELKKLLS